jgi:transcriptional regulator with XRE-family HTH domain
MGTKVRNGIRYYREKLKRREEKDATQQAVANFLTRPRSVISMWENGESFPNPVELEKLAEYLEVTPGHLYTPRQIDLLYEMFDGED